MTHRGADAEKVAEDFLRTRGLHYVTRNFRCRHGEIDLVMREGDVLVFVEVRQRAGNAFGGAAASITPAKQRRITAAARFYLAGVNPMPPCRFDAVLLTGNAPLEWIRDAFGE